MTPQTNVFLMKIAYTFKRRLLNRAYLNSKVSNIPTDATYRSNLSGTAAIGMFFNAAPVVGPPRSKSLTYEHAWVHKYIESPLTNFVTFDDIMNAIQSYTLPVAMKQMHVALLYLVTLVGA